MTKPITNPGPCCEHTHGIEITLVNWNNEPIPMYWDGHPSQLSWSGVYTISFPDRCVSVDLHSNNRILIENISPGVAKFVFSGVTQDLLYSLGHIPIPTYDKEDMRLKNGTGPYEPFHEELMGDYGRYPEVQENFHIIDLSRKVWELKQKESISPTEPLEFGTDDWTSHAEKQARRSGAYYHRICRRAISSGVKLEFELSIDANAENKITRHVIELVGQYSYIPALDYNDTSYNAINSYNLSLVSLLTYASLGKSEDGLETGSIRNVFTEMKDGRRPKRINTLDSSFILRLVPYAYAYDLKNVEHIQYNGFNILLATNIDTILIGCSGLPASCYLAEDLSKNISWSVAAKPDAIAVGYMDTRVHEGTKEIHDNLTELVEKYFGDSSNRNKDIFISAHCFGGGVASLLLYSLSEWSIFHGKTKPPLLYTFGMPRLFAKTTPQKILNLAQEIVKVDVADIKDYFTQNLRCKCHHRIVKTGDIICWLPFTALVVNWNKRYLHMALCVYQALRRNIPGALMQLFSAITSPSEIHYQPWGILSKNVCLKPTEEAAIIQPKSYPVIYADVISYINNNNLNFFSYVELLEKVFSDCKEHHKIHSYNILLQKELESGFHHMHHKKEKQIARRSVTKRAVDAISNLVNQGKRSPVPEIMLASNHHYEAVRKDVPGVKNHFQNISISSNEQWNPEQELILHFPLESGTSGKAGGLKDC